LEQTYRGQVASREVWIRISGDRGDWAITIRTSAMTHWIVPATWLEYIDDCGSVELTIEEQADFIRNRLDAVVDAATSGPFVEDRMVKMEENHMRGIYGLPLEP
jgi:hypothetical protein